MEIILFAALGFMIGILINRIADNLLRDRAEGWSGALPIRPLVVDLASAAGLALLWLRYGAAGLTVQFILSAVYTEVLLLVLVTDWERRYIFNIVILPAILIAALASPFSGIRTPMTLLGGALALVVFLAIYLFSKLFARWRGLTIQGGVFGQGDVTLATFIGLVTGFPAVINALLSGILLAGVGAFLLLAYHLVVHRRFAALAVIPYGPFLCIAGWYYMVFR